MGKDNKMTGLQMKDKIIRSHDHIEEYRGVKGYFGPFVREEYNGSSTLCYGWVSEFNGSWYGDYVFDGHFLKDWLSGQFKKVVDKLLSNQKHNVKSNDLQKLAY